jgi:Rps23 Pro-64 3,4-dihydroxylase Tpa1-like proline 4-hydroxylase
LVDAERIPLSARWKDAAASLCDVFKAGTPFPLLVLDEFLEPQFAQQLLKEFPPMEDMPRSKRAVFAKHRRQQRDLAIVGPACKFFEQSVVSEEFNSFLREATGMNVFVDPSFYGAGFHQGGNGSFLDMHADFSEHPVHRNWIRTINVLLYLNLDWRPEFGGDLLVKSAPEQTPRAIEPLFNRAVIMLTDAHTFHGYQRMSLPTGVTRKSLAVYAYREEEPSTVTPRSTRWVPEGAGLIKRLLAQHYDRAVRIENRVFGKDPPPD